jgi:hypothetical protein
LVAVAVGKVFTVTVTLEVFVHPFTVTVTVYVPLIVVVAFVRDGFCKEDEYPPGPFHAYVAPVTVGVVKFMVLPAHTGELLPAVAVGNAFTVTVVDEVVLHPPEVTVTVYTPLIAAVELVIEGLRIDAV